MKVYAERSGMRVRQVAADAAVLLWVAVWVRIGMWLHDLVAQLAAAGRVIEDAGDRFADGLDRVAGTVADVPVVGGALRAPFVEVAGAGRTLESAGQTQQEVVMTLALWLGVLIAVLPILAVLGRHLPGRIRWSREASAAAAIRDEAADLRVFAYRAIANRSLVELRRVTRDPVGAVERGEERGLAELELRSLGLRTGAT